MVECDIPTAGRGGKGKLGPRGIFFRPRAVGPREEKDQPRAEFFIPAQGQR